MGLFVSVCLCWRGGNLYSFSFPEKLITGKKFLRICHSLHLSTTVDDAANEQRRGTAEFDHLCKIKPLYIEMREACKTNYHPGQEREWRESVDELEDCVCTVVRQGTSWTSAQ